jgi:hypothetical protein
LAESSNKNLIRIIRKIVGDNKRAWDTCLSMHYGLIELLKSVPLGRAHLSWFMV